jgi:hypothetical protein
MHIASTLGLAEFNQKGAWKSESKKRSPLFHAPDCGGEIAQSLTALH